MTEYTMPSCGNWAQCTVDRETGAIGSNCVQCEELNDYCGSFSGAGYGDYVPKSCVNSCCVDGITKIPSEVRKMIEPLAEMILAQIPQNDESNCILKTLGDREKVKELLVKFIFMKLQSGVFDPSDSSQLPKIFMEFAESYLPKIVKRRMDKGDTKCFTLTKDGCKQGVLVYNSDKTDIDCVVDGMAIAKDQVEFYKNPWYISAVVIAVLAIALFVFYKRGGAPARRTF